MDDFDVTQNEQGTNDSINTADGGAASGRSAAAPSRSARRSRRATRPAMTPDRPTLDVFAELGIAGPAAEGADDAAPADVVIDDAAIDAAVADAEQAAAAEAETEDEVEEEVEPETPAEVDDEDGAPRLPATALLFQAPDMTPRRRRRASASAGAPAPDAGETQEQAAGDQAEHTEHAEPPQPETELSEGPEAAGEDDGEDESGAPRRRRRRGGRGRRKPKDTGDGESGSDAVEGDGPEGADGAEGAAPGEPSEAERSGGDEQAETAPRQQSKRRRGGRGQAKESAETAEQAPVAEGGDAAEADSATDEQTETDGEGGGSRRRRRRRSRSGRDEGARARDEVTALKGSTRLEAKRQRRRDGRDANRRRSIITEAEFLARRESVDRAMVVRERGGRTQIAVLEDDVLVEHFVARKTQTSMVGNVYLGRVQNVLPSMEAAFVDLGRGRNAVLYAGEVNWDAAGLEGQPRRIEQALSSGDSVLVQVTKDPIGHKGARLTSQITLAGRYLVLVPSGAMTGISRKLPDTERNRLKKLLKEIVPEGQGVIVRTAAEGASEEELRRDVERLTNAWADIDKKVKKSSTTAPTLLKGEPELATRVVRDVFNEDFRSLTVQGDEAWKTISDYVSSVAPDLVERLHHWTAADDVFASHRIDEQLAKGMDRKVYLPSGGSLVIDRTEAMTVVDVNTGKFTGSGGTLEETVTRNNLEAAEEIVRQLRLRDIGGIIVVDFIDMVLESNRDLVLRRLVECLGRDRTRHQVAEVTSLGLVQMTRKRVGQGLVEAFSTTCEHCHGRGYVLHDEPVESGGVAADDLEESPRSGRGGRSRGGRRQAPQPVAPTPEQAGDPEKQAQVRATLAAIAAAAAHAHEEHELEGGALPTTDAVEPIEVVEVVEPVEVVEVVEPVEAVEVVEPVEVVDAVEVIEVDADGNVEETLVTADIVDAEVVEGEQPSEA